MSHDSHRYDLRVYYEDTDMAGIVYYANYLKFIERARSEWVEGLGIDQGRLRDEHGVVFVVRRVEADYLAPARYGDHLTVTTRVADDTGVRLTLDQQVACGDRVLFRALVTIVILGETGMPTRLPDSLRDLML
ncbi:MAG: tol-pal system-associated acyl-CoA thioesterase [Paracoccaceae bacterium]